MQVKDIVFFPAALLAAIIMVAIAYVLSVERPLERSVSGAQLGYERLTLQGRDLRWIYLPGDTQAEFIEGERDAYLELTGADGGGFDRPLLNPHYRLGPDVEVAFAGQQVKVTVRARQAGPDGAKGFALNYSAAIDESSDWQTYMLGERFMDYSFTYTTPPLQGEPALDYLGIRPDAGRTRSAMHIAFVRFQRLPAR